MTKNLFISRYCTADFDMTSQVIGHRILSQNAIRIQVIKTNSTLKIVKQFSSNTSYFIVCEAIYFGPYMAIIRHSYESSR